MANFCSNCGASVSGVNFCSNCGTAVNDAGAANNTNTEGKVPLNVDFNNTNTNSGSGFFNSSTAKTVAATAGTMAGISLLSSLLGGSRRRNMFTGLPTGILGMNMMRQHNTCHHHHGPIGHSPMWHSPACHSPFHHGPGGRGPFGFGGGHGHHR